MCSSCEKSGVTQNQVRELPRLLGRNILEAEILKEAVGDRVRSQFGGYLNDKLAFEDTGITSYRVSLSLRKGYLFTSSKAIHAP